LLRDAVLERQALPDDLRSVLPLVLRIAVRRVLHLPGWHPRPHQSGLGHLFAV